MAARMGPAAMAVVVAGAVVVGAAAVRWRSGGGDPATLSARVVDVVDGDTVRVALRGGRTETVRIIGVDTPETKKPGTPVQCFGPEASAYTEARLAGRSVSLELDTEQRDRYGRLLAYVRVDGRRFDDDLLRLGYGRLLVIPPNDRYGRALLGAESEARRARRGLWQAC